MLQCCKNNMTLSHRKIPYNKRGLENKPRRVSLFNLQCCKNNNHQNNAKKLNTRYKNILSPYLTQDYHIRKKMPSMGYLLYVNTVI